MVRERIKELVDFATTESPYRDANKGWLTDDVYLQWGKTTESTTKAGVELANVSIFWNPINQLASILLTVFLLASIFVFFAVSISHDRVQLSGPTSEVSPQVAPVLKKEVELDSEPINYEVAPEVVPIIEKEVESGITQRSSEFAAAALGGQKVQR